MQHDGFLSLQQVHNSTVKQKMKTLTRLTSGVLAFSLVSVSSVAVAQKRAMTFEDFAAVRNVSDPQVSPSGTSVLYSLRTTDVAKNTRTSVTYLIPVTGGTPRQFPSATVKASEARWSPDGKSVAYISGDQLWISAADGSNPRQITTINGGATGPVWSPTGDRIAFVSGVYADCPDDPCNVARQKHEDSSLVKAHVTDNLMYRHWNAWTPNTFQHLFVVPVNGG